jgi:integrase/recombinase XerD
MIPVTPEPTPARRALIPAPAAPLAAASLPEAAILAGQLAPSSIAKYRQDWAAYQAWCATSGAAPLAAASLAQWRAHLAGETAYSPHSLNRMIAACKRIVKEAAAQGLIAADVALPFAGVRGVKPNALRDRLKPNARTRISPADMRRLCDTPDPSTIRGKRDRALLHTLASSGVRISELAGLQVGHIIKRDGGYFLQVLGKGQAEPREAHLTREAHSAILAWLAARPILSAYVFTSFAGRGNRAQTRPITGAGAWQVVREHALAAGLEHVKPHDFRRFVGTQLAKQDIRKAQRALGHKRIDTTTRYVLDTLEAGTTEGLY